MVFGVVDGGAGVKVEWFYGYKAGEEKSASHLRQGYEG
jgi:hypothetical protein